MKNIGGDADMKVDNARRANKTTREMVDRNVLRASEVYGQDAELNRQLSKMRLTFLEEIVAWARKRKFATVKVMDM